MIECELTAFRDGAGRHDPFGSIGEAPHDLFAGMEVSFAVRREKTSRGIERLALTQRDERIEQSSIPWSGAAHITGGDDLHAARHGHCGRAASSSFDAPVEEVRHIDRESIAKDLVCGVEQGGMEALITTQQHAPMSCMGLELFPMNPDPLPGTWVTRFESLVTTRMSEGEQATQTPPTLGGLRQQQQPPRTGERIRSASGGASGGTSGGRRADRDLGTHQGTDARGFGCAVEAGGAVDAIAIGQRESRVLEFCRRQGEIFRIAACFEKGEGASGTQLDVVLGSGHISFSSYFRLYSILYLLHSLLPSRP